MRVTVERDAISRATMQRKIRAWKCSRKLPERIAAEWAQQMIDGKLQCGDKFPDERTMATYHVKAINTLLTAKHLLARSGWAGRSRYHRQWVPMPPHLPARPEQ